MNHFFKIYISVISFMFFLTGNAYSIPIGSKNYNLLQTIPQELKASRNISEEECRNALIKDPKNASLLACVATGAMNEKQWDKAISHWKNAIRFSKDAPEINYYIGLTWTYVQMKNLSEADLTIQKSLEFAPGSISLHFWQAILLDLKKESDLAKKKYIKIISLSPVDKRPIEFLYHAVAILQAGKVDTLPEAEKDLNEFLKTNPDHHEAMILLGQTCIKMKEPEKALSILKNAEKIDPDLPQLQILLAQANLMTGNSEAAIVHVRKILQSEPENITANFLAGTVYLKIGEAEKGIDYLNKVSEGSTNFDRSRVLLGEAYVSEGKMEEAWATIQELVEYDSKDPAVLVSFIRLLIAAGKYEDAVRQCDTFLNSHPDNNLILFMKVIALIDMEKLKEAEKILIYLVEGEGRFYPAYIQLIRMYAIQGDLGRALREVDDLIEKWPDHVVGYIMKGDLAYTTGDKAEALNSYNKALDIESGSIFILNKILNLHLENREFTKAEKTADQLTEINPDFHGAYLAKGIISMQEGKPEKAITYFQKVLDLNEKDFRAHNYLGIIKAETSIKESINHFETSLTLNPGQPGTYPRLVKLYMKIRDEKSAIKTSERWKDIYPDQGEPYELMAMICISKNQNSDAIGYLKKAISTEPGNPSFYLTLGSLYVKLGEQSKIIPLYEEALKNIPDNPVILNNLAWNYAENSRINDGLALAFQAEQQAPNDWNIKDTIAQIYLRRGEYNKAIDKYKDAIAINDKIPGIYLNIGKIYISIGNNKKALESIKEARNCAPSDYSEMAEIEKLIVSLEK